MFQNLEGLEVDHPGADVPHYPLNRFPLFRRVAMGRAISAARLLIAVPAGVEPPAGIAQEIGAVPAERGAFMDLSAVISNHEFDGFLFRFYGSHASLI
jgi:hypothetical protein